MKRFIMKSLILLLFLIGATAYSQEKFSETFIRNQFKHYLKPCTLGLEYVDDMIYKVHFYWQNPIIPCDGCKKICWLRGISKMKMLFRNGNSYTLKQISYDDCDNDIWAAYILDIPDEVSQEVGEILFGFLYDIEETPWAFINIEAQGFTYDLKPDSWQGINPTPERFFIDAIRMLKNE